MTRTTFNTQKTPHEGFSVIYTPANAIYMWRPQGTTGRTRSVRRQPAGLDAALGLLEEMKRELGGGQRALYVAFLASLNRFEGRLNAKNRRETRDQIRALLADHPHLLDKLREFIPAKEDDPSQGESPADAIAVDEDDDDDQGRRQQSDQDEEDVVVVSSSGHNALADFPHPRHVCAVFKFPETGRPATLARSHCPNCYCVLCDKPAQQCDHWASHAFALDTPAWRKIRDALRKARRLREETPPPLECNNALSASSSSVTKQNKRQRRR